MPALLEPRLQKARRQRFVGRELECEYFEALVGSESFPVNALHVYGPGGVGKTYLLREFGARAEAKNLGSLYLDARYVEPSPTGFLHAMHACLPQTVTANDADPHSALARYAAEKHKLVLLIDTYELLNPLDGWLCDDFLPTLPDNVLLVTAGRNPPASSWHDHPAWGDLIHPMPLRNLNAAESCAYLLARNVPENQLNSIVSFTHGHPLALSLVADTAAQRADGGVFEPEDNPDVIKTLLERFVQKVPGQAHRAALEACGLVRVLTEALLARMLGTLDAHELFEWLRSLSFVDTNRAGLFPHDLAREAICADVRWRNPDWYAELHKRAREYYNTRLQHASDAEQVRILFDMVFLHRDNVVVRQTFDWQESGTIRAERAHQADYDQFVEWVRSHEGDASATIARFWFTEQPDGVIAFRDNRGTVGFMCLVALDQITGDQLKTDKASASAWAFIRKNAPLRSGERATLFRFWMSGDSHQAVSPLQSLAFVQAVHHYMITPKLAYTIFTVTHPDIWLGVFAYADLDRLTTAEVDIENTHVGMFGHDWRIVPVPAWFDLLAEREKGFNPQAAQPPRKLNTEVIALDEDGFAEALRDALKLKARSLPPRGNPLLASRIVIERSGATAGEMERVSALNKLVAEVAQTFEQVPRDIKLYRAFYHTYIKPAPSQEAAAELIDVPFSSYRRHLQTAIERITDKLWIKEIGG